MFCVGDLVFMRREAWVRKTGLDIGSAVKAKVTGFSVGPSGVNPQMHVRFLELYIPPANGVSLVPGDTAKLEEEECSWNGSQVWAFPVDPV